MLRTAIVPAKSSSSKARASRSRPHIAEYPPEYHAELRKVLAIGDSWNPDRVIVLTSNTDTIEKHIRQRNRAARERREHGAALPADRRRVPAARAGLSEHRRHQPRPHGIPRTRRLVAIIQAAGLPMFREIPYEKLDRYE
jgi:hypothetical protein